MLQNVSKPRFTEAAKQDLFKYASFIAADNPTAAKQWRDKIKQACSALAKAPLIGRDRSELQDNLRSFPVGRFVIFYQPLKKGALIVRVLRGAMDVNKIFIE